MTFRKPSKFAVLATLAALLLIGGPAWAVVQFIYFGGPVGDQGTFAVLGGTTCTFPSDSDYACSQAEYAGGSIYVTGTISTTRKIKLPLNVGEAKDIFNATTGGQSITVGGATGAATVAIPNGTEARVVTPDGVNYYAISGGGGSFDAAAYDAPPGWLYYDGGDLNWRNISSSDLTGALTTPPPIGTGTPNVGTFSSANTTGSLTSGSFLLFDAGVAQFFGAVNVNFASNSDVTLSSSQDNKPLIIITGTGLSVDTASLIIPTSSGPYWMINESGHIITIKASSGTAVALNPNRMGGFVNDGSNTYPISVPSAALLNTMTFTGDTTGVGEGGTVALSTVQASGRGVNPFTDSGTVFNMTSSAVVLAADSGFPIYATSAEVNLVDSTSWVTVFFNNPADHSSDSWRINCECQDRSVDSGGAGIPNTTSDRVSFGMQVDENYDVSEGGVYLSSQIGTAVGRQVNLILLSVNSKLDGGSANTTNLTAQAIIKDAGADAAAATAYLIQLKGFSSNVYHCSCCGTVIEILQ